MADRDGEYCFSYLSYSFLRFYVFYSDVSGQLHGHLVPYDVESVVILILCWFLVVEAYRREIERCKQ